MKCNSEQQDEQEVMLMTYSSVAVGMFPMYWRRFPNINVSVSLTVKLSRTADRTGRFLEDRVCIVCC